MTDEFKPSSVLDTLGSQVLTIIGHAARICGVILYAVSCFVGKQLWRVGDFAVRVLVERKADTYLAQNSVCRRMKERALN